VIPGVLREIRHLVTRMATETRRYALVAFILKLLPRAG
jgi:hypothetical protein